MKTLARNSLLMAAVVAVISVNLPQANAQQCQARGGYYRPYPVRKVVVPVQPVAHQQVLVQRHVQPAVDPGMQLVDLRMVDPGAQGQAGPKIRVIFRNASPFAVSTPFDVVLAAAINDQFAAELPIIGQRVTEIAPGETAVVDLRLPPQALEMAFPGEARPAPFQNLLVMVSQARDLQGNPQFQKLAVIPRLNLQLVDMRIDPAAQAVAPAGAVITLTGEGFGTQPGQALLALGSLKLAGEIVDWNPRGVKVRLPALALAQAAPAEITLIRADNAVAGMSLQVTPAAVVQTGVQVQVEQGVAGAAVAPQQGVPAQGAAPQGFNPQQAGPQGPVQGFNPQQQQGVPQQQGAPQQAGPQGPVQGFTPQQQGVPQQQGQGQAQTAPPQQLPGLGLLQGQGPVR